MSEPAQQPPVERHEGPIKTPKQLIVAVLLSFIVPITVIVLLTEYVSSASKPGAGSELLDDKAIAARLQRVGHVEVAALSDPATPAAEAAAPGADASAAPTDAASAMAALSLPAAAAAPAAASGGVPALYTQVCGACHDSGLAGAPKLGDKAAWQPRITAEGLDGLVTTAMHGKGAMPPRGGSAGSDADIKTVVTYMIDAVK